MRQKRCVHCHNLFEPDPRSKGKQHYCSNKICQVKRQRKNEAAWRVNHPKALEKQRQQSRKWHKTRPYYSYRRRSNDPGLEIRNRNQTRLRMKKIRVKKLFDKSKLILTQLSGIKADKCYLTRGYRWLFVRLTKASPLSKSQVIRDNRADFNRVTTHVPRGDVYDLSEKIFNRAASSP